MKKLLAVLGLVACTAANASNWVKVSESNHSSVYLDMDTIRSVSSLKYAWSLYDKKTPSDLPDGKAIRSFKTLDAFSCSAGTYVTKSSVFYSDQNAHGEIVSTDNSPQQLSYVIPDSTGEKLWKAVCKQN